MISYTVCLLLRLCVIWSVVGTYYHSHSMWSRVGVGILMVNLTNQDFVSKLIYAKMFVTYHTLTLHYMLTRPKLRFSDCGGVKYFYHFLSTF